MPEPPCKPDTFPSSTRCAASSATPQPMPGLSTGKSAACVSHFPACAQHIPSFLLRFQLSPEPAHRRVRPLWLLRAVALLRARRLLLLPRRPPRRRVWRHRHRRRRRRGRPPSARWRLQALACAWVLANFRVCPQNKSLVSTFFLANYESQALAVHQEAGSSNSKSSARAQQGLGMAVLPYTWLQQDRCVCHTG